MEQRMKEQQEEHRRQIEALLTATKHSSRRTEPSEQLQPLVPLSMHR